MYHQLHCLDEWYSSSGTHLGSESVVQREGREIQQLLRPVKVDIAYLHVILMQV